MTMQKKNILISTIMLVKESWRDGFIVINNTLMCVSGAVEIVSYNIYQLDNVMECPSSRKKAKKKNLCVDEISNSR